MTILERLFSIGPIRKKIWQLWYPYLTRRLRSEDVCFLNYAFQTDPPVDLDLLAEDDANRGCIQLYHHLASKVDLEGRDILEVSCGHGGGASWIARSMQPATYTGLDLNPDGIDFCRQRHVESGLEFVQGDAQSLPFADGVLDVAVNVEASHCYPDFPGFLSEIERVLRVGGDFLYADFRFRDQFEEWQSAIDGAALEVVETSDISAEVLRGMDMNGERSLALVERCLPGILQASGRDFAGVPGTRVYDALASGELAYRSWHFKKR